MGLDARIDLKKSSSSRIGHPKEKQSADLNDMQLNTIIKVNKSMEKVDLSEIAVISKTPLLTRSIHLDRHNYTKLNERLFRSGSYWLPAKLPSSTCRLNKNNVFLECRFLLGLAAVLSLYL